MQHSKLTKMKWARPTLSTRNQRQRATIPESKGVKHACPSLGNPLRSATGLTRSQLSLKIRHLEALPDIPVVQRLKWMQTSQLEIPEHRGPLIAGIKRLKATAKGPKYPVFYDISPLINFSFPDPSPILISSTLPKHWIS